MKALTLYQPWASLIALGVKTVETRPWATKYRGPLAIHAGKVKPSLPETRGWIGRYCLGLWADDVDHADPCDCDHDEEQLGDRCAIASGADPALLNDEGAHGFSLATKLPLGAVIATCTLVDVVSTDSITWFPNHGIGGDRRWGLGDRCAAVIEEERHYGNYETGRYAWLLDDVEVLPEPVPAQGRQQLWEWTP